MRAGSPDALPGCVRFRFCLWRKYLLKICSRYSTRAVPAAGERGRLSSSSRTNWRKIYRCLKKKEEETKSGKKTRCQRQQRRDGDVDVSVGGSPCLTQLCTKFMIFYLSVGEGEQPARARARTVVGGRWTGRERIAPAFSINSSP